ncbi:MAG: hypothetical protein AAGG00_03745 [Cyanobacteria bacterium P01_H01_bin.150]
MPLQENCAGCVSTNNKEEGIYTAATGIPSSLSKKIAGLGGQGDNPEFLTPNS